MKIRHIAALLLVVLMAVCAFAEGTRTWEQSKPEELEKGTASGVAIRSDGTLELAPAFKAITTTPSTYIWSCASAPDGTVYLATGSPARVYRITADGKSSMIFEPQELQVQALAVGSKGEIYAGTSPDGKVYKLEPRSQAAAAKAPASGERATGDGAWNSSVFFEPKTKYIWDLALDHEGRLYVATGDHGEIFRVTPAGDGALFFKSDEAHIRVLAFDPKGNLIAGSDGSGLIYRISPAGEAFVLYSAPKKEITALALDNAGNIFVAGVGDKRPTSAAPMPAIPPRPVSTPAPATVLSAPGARAATTSSTPPPAIMSLPFPAANAGAVGSEVYEIAPDGSPKRIWSSRDEVVYALAFDGQGNLLAGTGNKGRIFAIRGEQQFTDLMKASATQVTAFAKAPNGGIYVCTSNLGKLFLLGSAPAAEGSFQSDVFDARIFSRWGRAEVRGEGSFALWTRSGNVDNPDRNWSPWKQAELDKDAPIPVPPARFVQWKAVLRPGSPPARIYSVLLNYLPKNVAPVVDEVVVQTGTRYAAPSRPVGGEMAGSSASPAMSTAPPPPVRDRGSIGVRWSVHDDNDDQMVYALYYRGDTETRWKLLKDKITDKFYSFDAGLLPDGGYVIKVVASDAPSHSPAEALSDERESARFEVDTTPPRIDNLTASVSGDTLRVTFRASDSFSPIKRAEFSVDAGEWQLIEPEGELSDARTESYQFAVPLGQSDSRDAGTAVPATGRGQRRPRAGNPARKATDDPPSAAAEHLVVVRVWDRFDNMGAAKTVVRTK